MRIPLTGLTLCLAGLLSAVQVYNLNDASHVSGPKLTEKQLEGKVLAVEVWGKSCPPCLNSLPHMAKLHKEIAKLPVVLIGSHCQGRDDEQVKEILKKAGCEYSVYQFFKVEDEPRGPGIPYAYVVSPKGEIVWHGHPLKGFAEAVKDEAKKVPKMVPGSLVNGVEAKYCKDMIRRLVVGSNVEGALKQLEARAAKGGAAGEEAQALIDRCTAWADAAEEEIRANLESCPSKALVTGKRFLRTFPARAAELKPELAALSKDNLTKKLATAREALEKLQNTEIKSDNIRKRLLSSVKFQQRMLATLKADAENEDFADLKALLDAFESTLTVDGE